jgi:hypothetical protein
MRRRDKTNGMGATVQYCRYSARYIIERKSILNYRPEIATDLIILTIAALQIAMAEKDVADTVLSADHRLFAAMQANGTDLIPRSGLTISQFPGQTIYTAFSGAAVT